MAERAKAIDPLRMTSEPAEPIADSSIVRFMTVRDRIVAELKGELPRFVDYPEPERYPRTFPDSPDRNCRKSGTRPGR